ncbi:5-carboxymethyl-2-hydroxymuconate Delta-isomerase [Nitratireductor soli]|uniref:5-carboxymethyl-2-hydroxymuconate Delta-isomerase n=1 Tax=Nitratireductor soli TaxID=1670619 RepID=UPI00065E0971|nr:5-carboxymethyl-2-hydroxymuconate Delta-isomerase [Nitratireductor soli]
MPHFIFEYSANLERHLDIGALCDSTLRVAVETGVFEKGGIRVRAHRCDAYAIADGLPENAFLHLMVRIGAGRPLEVRKAAGERVFEALSAFCAPLLARPHFALSFELCEIDPETSWKKNTIHPRLRDDHPRLRDGKQEA